VRPASLRLVSTLLLTVVFGLSAARVVCAWPCRDDVSAAADGSNHCEHSSPEAPVSIKAHMSACDACHDAGIAPPDRLSGRDTLNGWIAFPAGISATHAPADSFDPVRVPGPPPGRTISTTVSTPLRI
jgi:hypothetical protein